jgi:hypothetical protein
MIRFGNALSTAAKSGDATVEDSHGIATWVADRPSAHDLRRTLATRPAAAGNTGRGHLYVLEPQTHRRYGKTLRPLRSSAREAVGVRALGPALTAIEDCRGSEKRREGRWKLAREPKMSTRSILSDAEGRGLR